MSGEKFVGVDVSNGGPNGTYKGAYQIDPGNHILANGDASTLNLQPGEMNTLEVTVNNQTVSFTVNDSLIGSFTLSDVPPAGDVVLNIYALDKAIVRYQDFTVQALP